MALRSGDQNLRARKSWICLDEMIFCMGPGIANSNTEVTRAILENRNLHEGGTNQLIVNGTIVTETRPSTLRNGRTSRASEATSSPTARRSPMFVWRGTKTGRWSDINPNSPANADGTERVQRNNYVIMSLNHASQPTNAGYVYMVVPKATPERAAELYATRSQDVWVIGNNANRSGIRQKSTGLVMVNFWQSATLDRVTVNAPCSVIVQEKNNTLKIAVANPRRSGAKIRVTVSAATGYKLASKESAITVVSTGSSIVLDIASGMFGRTYSAVLAV